MTQQDLLSYYASLLIVQYKGLPKATQHIQCLANCASVDGLAQQLQTCFNLNTAVGNQLTILGKIVGVPRNIYGLDLSHQFFNFTRYTGTPTSNGFGRYTVQPDATLITRYLTNAIYVATDFELLSLIQLKIVYNNAFESLYFVKNSLYKYFSGSIDITDNLNSTITYKIKQPYYTVATIATYLGNIFPKPMGIGISVTQI